MSGWAVTLAGAGGVVLGLALLAYVWWSSRDYRKVSSDLRKTEAALNDARTEASLERTMMDSAVSALLEKNKTRDREIVRLRKEIAHAETLLVQHGGPDLLVAMLRRALSPKAADRSGA